RRSGSPDVASIAVPYRSKRSSSGLLVVYLVGRRNSTSAQYTRATEACRAALSGCPAMVKLFAPSSIDPELRILMSGVTAAPDFDPIRLRAAEFPRLQRGYLDAASFTPLPER